MSLVLHVTQEVFSAISDRPPASIAADATTDAVPVVVLCMFDGTDPLGRLYVGYSLHGDLPAPLRAACQEDVDRKLFFSHRYCNTDVIDEEYDFKGFVPEGTVDEDDVHARQFEMLISLREEILCFLPNAYILSSLPDDAYICGYYYLDLNC